MVKQETLPMAPAVGTGTVEPIHQARQIENPQIDFFGKILLLAYRVRLDKSFPKGPCSTFGDKNSLKYDLGPHHCDCHVSTQ